MKELGMFLALFALAWFVVAPLLVAVIKAVGNYFEDGDQKQYERGVKFAAQEIAFYEGDSQKLWPMCHPSFDNNPFDKGMADELTRQGIRHPLDPRGE